MAKDKLEQRFDETLETFKKEMELIYSRFSIQQGDYVRKDDVKKIGQHMISCMTDFKNIIVDHAADEKQDKG